MRDALGDVQSVLLLGGSSEIGLAIVDELVNRRCRDVVLAGRDLAALGAHAEAIGARGATRTEAVAFDAADTASHDTVIDAVFDSHGDIDLVIVAFGVLGPPFEPTMDTATAAEIAQVNYVGGVTACLAATRRLLAQGHGTLLVISSVAGERVRKANALYGSTKAGLDGFAQGLGDAVVGTGVRVQILRPGFVHSRMTEGMDPAPLATTPDKVAADTVRGLRSGSPVIWSPAPLRAVTSALRHLPRPVWRRVSDR